MAASAALLAAAAAHPAAALACPLSCNLQTVVIDCRGHMLGRLASIIAKQLLSGQHIVSRAGAASPHFSVAYQASQAGPCSLQQASAVSPCCLQCVVVL